MILDEKVQPFTRIWCLFEVKRLTDLNKAPSRPLLSGEEEGRANSSEQRKEM